MKTPTRYTKSKEHIITTKTRKSNACLLIPLYKINNQQLTQLASITKNKQTMQYIGKGNIWTLNDLKQFIKDEYNQHKLTHINRQYYTFIMICNNNVVGFIAGRKQKSLLPTNSTPYDLLLRMFISTHHTGKGLGKLILKLFINTYTILIQKYITTPIKLISDIDKNNIASIKIHTANNFIHTDTITYPNKHKYQRYTLTIQNT